MDVAAVCNDLEKVAFCEDDIAKRKDDIRKQVWDYMEQYDLVEDYPRPCHNKIPHFKVSNHSFLPVTATLKTVAELCQPQKKLVTV